MFWLHATCEITGSTEALLLSNCNRQIKAANEKAYISMEKSAEEKEKGNQAFKDQDYPKAVQHYTEALKRGPPEVIEYMRSISKVLHSSLIFVMEVEKLATENIIIS